ncbi:MAG: CHASE2 domain-containing protein, partial [Prochlorococcus sp.]
RQFQLRLKATTRKQWLAAATAVILGGVFDVVPTNPASHYLLDRRLYLQKIWRQGIGKPGPTAAAIPVVVIDQNTFQKVGAKKVPKRVSRQTLAKLLQATPPVQVPKVAIDVVLDENAPHIEELAEVIKNQQRRLVFAGYFGPNVEAPSSGATSKPQQVLKDAGLKAFNLSIGTIASGSELQEAPLRLAEAITSANFSAQLSDQPSRVMPAEAVLDWSLDWQSMIHRVEPDQLSTLNAPVLLIGSDGTLDPEKRDEFKRPGALNPNLSSLWKGSRNKVPGVIVQAVLAQSLNLKHWLTPMSSAIAAGLTAALAVALSALVDKRRKRLAICVGIAVVAIPLCMQIAISSTWLLPLVLPLGALIVISFMRED